MTHPTACSRSWTDVNINFKRGKMGHCCKAEYHAFPDEYTTEFFTNSKHIQKRRQDTLNGIQHSDCKSCWDAINNGINPSKDWMNIWDNFDQPIDKPHIEYIEVELDNTCDLSCLYCSADESSKIAQEEGITFTDKTRQKDIEIYKEWLKDTVNNSPRNITLAFMGGEPTASKLFYELIEYIVTLDTSKLTLQITTNCNTKDFLFKKFLNAIDKCDKSGCIVEINISNESYKDDSVLIRYGLDWDRFEKNVSAYALHEKVTFISFDVTMNILALPTFSKYVQWIFNTMSKYNKPFSIAGDMVHYPGELDVAILPVSFKTYIDQAIQIVNEKELPNCISKDRILSFMKAGVNRIGSNYQEDYKDIVKQFLEPKQKFKNTDKLMRLIEPLGEIQ